MKTFRYILRYQIDPYFEAKDRVGELLEYCQESLTEEVMLFLNAEELSTGHLTFEELTPYIEIGKYLRELLHENGIELSLNPWTTTYHIHRGRKIKPGQDFTLMVGETGLASPIAVCPLCLQWQQYIAQWAGKNVWR